MDDNKIIEDLMKSLGETNDENGSKETKVFEFLKKFSDVLDKYEATMKVEDGKIVFASERFGKVTM